MPNMDTPPSNHRRIQFDVNNNMAGSLVVEIWNFFKSMGKHYKQSLKSHKANLHPVQNWLAAPIKERRKSYFYATTLMVSPL